MAILNHLSFIRAQVIVAAIVLTSASAFAESPNATMTPTTSPSAAPTSQPSHAPNNPYKPFDLGHSGTNLTLLSLEDLMNLEVTSVSKRVQRIGDAPAAITLITQEDIRRSGMDNIPELLRLSPGLSVARFNSNVWAITSRGFSDVYANKLLVLMDGRTIYNPHFGGIYWDQVDYLLPDLDRIEVIRGPGSTLWGANAVNGVINITTKSADQTQGWLLDSRVGTDTSAQGVRYGGQLDEQTYYRVFAKARYYGNSATADGDDANDNWTSGQFGFRVDRFSTPQDVLTLSGQLYTERYNETRSDVVFEPPFSATVKDGQDVFNGHLLGRWTHKVSSDSEFSLQMFYDHQSHPEVGHTTPVDTFDIDFQHRFQLSRRQEMTWGLGARWVRDDVPPTAFLDADPRNETNSVYSVFVQDKIELVPDRLQWYLGTKLEHNSFTGLEVQPSTRLLWSLNERNVFWGAVTRSVRTPGRYESDVRQTYATFPIDDATLGLVEKFRNRDLESESVLSYELGYRVQVTPTVSVDVTGFVNHYKDYVTYAESPPEFQPGPPPQLLFPIVPSNAGSAETYGGEVAATWRVTDDWQLTGSYSLLFIHLHDAGTDEPAFEGASPQHQFQIRSHWALTRHLALNAQLFFVDSLAFGDVPAYIRADANLTWEPKPGMEWSIGVQNVLDDRHPEFRTDRTSIFSAEPELAAYARMIWRF